MKLPDRTLAVPAVLVRGGTSRGLVFKRTDLPADRALWDLIFLCALGSPDVRQLDGVGAGDSHTSKVAVVSPSTREDADIDFLFGEVAIDEARVDYAGNSGNIISALGPFAIDEGWVRACEESTPVRIHNENTGKPIRLTVPTPDHNVADDGDFHMPGVPGVGPRIDMQFPSPAGALTGRLLTDEGVRSRFATDDGRDIDATLLDAANPVVFVDGPTLGVAPGASPQSLNADSALLATLQRIRAEAAVRFGLVEHASDAWAFSAMVPFLVLLFPPSTYPDLSRPSDSVEASDMDLCVRVLSLNMIHKSVNVTVSVATTAAAMVPGTLVHEMSQGAAMRGALRIGHPSGVTDTGGEVDVAQDPPQVQHISLGRTARRIMQGEVLIQPYKLRWLHALRSRRDEQHL